MPKKTKRYVPCSLQDAEHIWAENEMEIIIGDAAVRATQRLKGSPTERPYLLAVSDSPSGYETLSDQYYPLKLEQANAVIDYLMEYLLKSDLDLKPIKLIETAASEIEMIYKAIEGQIVKKQTRWSGQAGSSAVSEEQLRDAVLNAYASIGRDFQYLKPKHFDGDSCAVAQTKERRDFIGKVLFKVLKDNGFNAASYQGLYERFVKKKKRRTKP